MSQNPIWINTRVEMAWDNDKQEYVVVSREGYWYNGPMALAHNTPSLDQDSFAFYNDGTESGSTIIGTANTAQTLDSDTTYLVRFLIQEVNGASSNNFASQLEYDVNNSGTFNNVTSTSNNVRAVVSGSLGTDGSNTTQRLGAGTFITANAGVDNGDGAAGNTSFSGSDEAEVVFAIQFRNADLTDQDTVQLRIAGVNSYTRTASATINVSAPAITGTLAATETGSDTAAMSGTVEVSGTLAASETGSDTAAMSGGVAISGTLAATETGSDSASMTGTVTEPGITGTLAATESGSDTAAMSGNVAISGSLAATETGSDTASATGTVEVSGTLSAAETGNDTATMSGGVEVSGSLAASETGSDAAAMTGVVIVTGTLDATETGSDTAAMSGQVLDPGIVGTMAATESGSDTATMTGTVTDPPITGTMAAQETGSDIASMAGTVTTPGISGILNAQEAGSDTASMTGSVAISGLFGAIEGGQDTFGASGTIAISGSMGVFESGTDDFAASGMAYTAFRNPNSNPQHVQDEEKEPNTAQMPAKIHTEMEISRQFATIEQNMNTIVLPKNGTIISVE